MEGLRGSMVVGVLVSLSIAAVACTTTVTDGNGSSSGQTPNTNNNNPGQDSGTNPSTDGGTNPNDPNKPPPGTTVANIDIDGTCPSFAGCGGSPSGTYDYTAGCIEDVFKKARAACPGLDTSNAKVTVKGSIYFLANAALHRAGTVDVSGSIKFPLSCSQGQCAAIEDGLKGSFKTATCTGSTDCTCTISDSTTDSSATTYTIAGSTVTTADGDKYEICEKAGVLEYKGKNASAEEGVWSLKKR